MTNLVWFRNDLRTIDNPALFDACQDGPVMAVFCINEQQWLQHDWGPNKIGYVLHSLLKLQRSLNLLNIELTFVDCSNFAKVPAELLKLAKKCNISKLYFNNEYELNEKNRDKCVIELFIKNNITVCQFDDQCLIVPGKVLTQQHTPYTVFTPFRRTCYAYLNDNGIRIIQQPKPQSSKQTSKSSLPPYLDKYLNNLILHNYDFGQEAALSILEEFCENRIKKYATSRDFPALDGTSIISPHLSVGTISTRQCFVAAINQNSQRFADGNSGIVTWISELVWRDFYRHIIYHFPNICKGRNFNPKYDNLKWNKPSANFDKWQQGKTGIPIIDAAMRQLVTTGWMHNRLRMIVAMFLTKNLLIDWRLGEKFFSQHLVDLDFASNNGGWQWSASTGTDAAPYFRIFNPLSQSAKFDKDGLFIKTYCPELKNYTSAELHAESENCIVDLKKSRVAAIQAFKSL